MVRRSALGCAWILLVGCTGGGGSSNGMDAGPAAPTCPAGLPAVAGETTETVMVGGLARTYILHVRPRTRARPPCRSSSTSPR